MKLKTIFAAALCFAAIQIGSFAQKTEVSVQKGKVAAETEKGTFNIDAGRKAVLEKNDAPKVFVDDPIVQDLLEMYKWVQAEKDANLIRIDSASIQIISIENDQLCKGAGYNECPNEKNEPSKTCEITGTLILEKNKIYDLEGNLLTFDMKPISKTNCNIYIHFQKEIEPGEKFKFICVGESKPSLGFWKQGNLWHHVMENNPRYCVNYFRVILPKSAIFVESNRNILTSGIIDGRVAITTRNYTGENARGLVHSIFLWPEKDGTSLADLAEGFSSLGKNDLSQFNSERENVTKKLGSIPWDKADKQVLDLYNQFVIKKIDSSGDWFVLGIKLVGGGYWEQALDSFESSTNLAKEKINPDYVSSIIWQGHVLDIVNKRDQAIAKYKEVLDFMEQFRVAQALPDFENYVFMRHDQWDIKLTYNWIKERLEKPFTKEMIGK